MNTTSIKNSQKAPVANEATPAPPKEILPQVRPAAANPPQPAVAPPPRHSNRKWLLVAGIVAALGVAGYSLVPFVDTALNTESTDDAYVNGHPTYVAPRIKGHVAHVLVDDNKRVKKGDLLVQLDSEPYRVEVVRKQAALDTAQAKFVQARASVRATVATAKAQRFKLQDAMQEVRGRVQQLQADVATLKQYQANRDVARKEYNRTIRLVGDGQAASQEELDTRRAAYQAAEALVRTGQENVRKTRAGLNLSLEPPEGKDLGYVPPDLEQYRPSVRSALAQMIETAAHLGVELPPNVETPNQFLARYHLDTEDSWLEDFVRKLVEDAPAIKVALADVEQARADLAQARLDLSYCDIVSDIDGVVTSRNVNPGNDVQAGQSLMAVRSTTQIWIDANFGSPPTLLIIVDVRTDT